MLLARTDSRVLVRPACDTHRPARRCEGGMRRIDHFLIGATVNKCNSLALDTIRHRLIDDVWRGGAASIAYATAGPDVSGGLVKRIEMGGGKEHEEANLATPPKSKRV